MNEPLPQIRKHATYQDVLDAPPNMVAELINGALHVWRLPSPRHALAISRLSAELGRPFYIGEGGPGSWWILNKPELHLGEDAVVPDLGGWRRERMPEFPDTAAFDLAPDWACEILSPSTRRIDLTEKRDIYLREGVKHLWFVDPAARTLEAFENRDGTWVLIVALKDADDVCVAPFDAITFELSALWPD
ncbi:MAG: Uma2 family endonuclease [Pseudomonadota bacterium]